MRYLWRMSISEGKVLFKYTDWTPKKQKESFNNLDFYTDMYLIPEGTYYNSIAQAALSLCNALEIDYKTDVEIANGFQKMVVSTDKVLFYLISSGGSIKISTENDTALDLHQIIAIFKFAKSLKKHGWI